MYVMFIFCAIRVWFSQGKIKYNYLDIILDDRYFWLFYLFSKIMIKIIKQ